jgi:hypothetical protein
MTPPSHPRPLPGRDIAPATPGAKVPGAAAPGEYQGYWAMRLSQVELEAVCDTTPTAHIVV